MKGTSKKRVYRSEQEWRELCSRYDESEQKQVSFCKSESIGPSSLHKWRKKLSESDNKEELFVEVAPHVNRRGVSHLTIKLPCGTELYFGEA